jgi:chromosome segregation ATPase
VATPAAREVWAKPVDRWLTERGFRKADGIGTTWRRDPVATQQLLLEEKEQLISQLKDQVAKQEGRLQEFLNRNQELSGECEKLRVSLDDLTAEHLKVLSELDEQRERREALTLQLKRFDDELDKLLSKMANDYEGTGGEDSLNLDSSSIECESGDGLQPDFLPRE